MRYLIALFVAVIFIGLAALFVVLTENSFEQQCRQAMRAAKANGTLPAEINPDGADLGVLADFAIEVPSSIIFRVKLARFLGARRYVLMTIALLGSLAVAQFSNRKSPRDNSATAG